MKTTIDIADSLLKEAKSEAERKGTTLRALVEDGLRRVLGASRPQKPFRLKKASFRGKGLQSDLGSSWDPLRDSIYEGRGG